MCNFIKINKMTDNMLEHQKVILKAVSNNIILFQKELVKSLVWLNEREQILLREWVDKNFNQSHKLILNSVFPLKEE